MFQSIEFERVFSMVKLFFLTLISSIISCKVSSFSPPKSISYYLAVVKQKFSKGYGLASNDDVKTEAAVSITKSNKFDKELNVLLDTMPDVEKYTILLQSYATQILESNARNTTTLKMMNILYGEMLQNAIVPSTKSSQVLIDAASVFRNSESLGRAIQLAKAGLT